MGEDIRRLVVLCGDEVLLDVLRSAEQEMDLSVLEARDGGHCLSLVSSQPQDSLLILDLEMIEVELFDKLRSREGTSILGLIRHGNEDAIPESIVAGVEDLLRLPASSRMLMARIRALLDSSRLKRALASQSRDLELILSLSRRLAGTMNIEEVLFQLVSEVAGTLGIDRCSIVLADEGAKRGLVLAASDNELLENLEVDLTRYPEIQAVLRTGEPLVIEETQGHPLLATVEDTLSAKGVNMLAVLPLQQQEGPMGVLFLRASRARGPFSSSMLRVANTVAHVTAVALRNAQMFQRIHQQSARATAEKAVAEKEVADLRQIETELRNTTDLLENLIDSSANAIVAADMRGKVRVWNKAAERVLGHSREEAVDQLDVRDIYYDDARDVMAALRAAESGGEGRLEEHPVHIISKDGERIPVTLSGAILYEDGKEIATVGILTDMRDKLRIEEKLSRAQDRLMRTEKQVMIAELAGTTAHELNQPLTSVMGYAELLKRRIPEGDPNHRAIDIIFRESERMAEIVRKIGRITRYETKDYLGKTRIVDLDRSAEDKD